MCNKTYLCFLVPDLRLWLRGDGLGYACEVRGGEAGADFFLSQ